MRGVLCRPLHPVWRQTFSDKRPRSTATVDGTPRWVSHRFTPTGSHPGHMVERYNQPSSKSAVDRLYRSNLDPRLLPG